MSNGYYDEIYCSECGQLVCQACGCCCNDSCEHCSCPHSPAKLEAKEAKERKNNAT